MSEPHTADLATRYRYREEGRQFEIERRNAWLNRVQTMYEGKANIWFEGYEMATNNIIKLLESELGQGNPDFITERDTTIERLIAHIKGENKSELT